MNQAFTLFLAASICLPLALQAQQSDDEKIEKQEIKVQIVKIQDNKSDFFTKELGAEIDFKATFKYAIADFFKKNYEFSFKLYTLKDSLLYDSEAYKQSTRVAAEDFINPKNTSPTAEEDFFVFYKYLQNWTGKQKVKIVISASHKQKSLPNIHSSEITLNVPVIQHAEASQQVFTVSNATLEQQKISFLDKVPGAEFRADINLKYGKSNLTNVDKYDIHWIWKDSLGNIVYDSRQDGSNFSKDETIYLSANGSTEKIECFSAYHKFKVLDKQNLILYLYTQVGQKDTCFFSKKYTLNIPTCYHSSEQKCTISNLHSKSTTQNGVQGIEITGSCHLAKTGFLCEQDSMVLHLELQNEAKELAFSSRSQPEMRYFAALDVKANPTKNQFDLKFFIPHYQLQTNEGQQTLQIALQLNNQAPFSVSTLKIQQPAKKKALVQVKNVQAVDKQYDGVENVKISGQGKPDLQICIYLGKELILVGEEGTNSFFAADMKGEIWFCQGDAVQVCVRDLDVTAHDELGCYSIPYQKLGNKINQTKLSFGDVKTLDLELEIK